MLIMPGVQVVLGSSKAEAEDKYAQIQTLIHPDLGVTLLSELVAMDLSSFPIDGPLPEVPPSHAQRGRQSVIVDMARRENLTIRQLYMRVVGQRGHRTICGTARDIADSLEHWYTSGAADGFNILTPTLPDGIAEFTDQVIPELQRRGLFRTAYEGKTLRENLGLTQPVNRYSEGRQSAAE
jgi:alkanesulfonate monooxygenase SsuD/methylene tetrahydromethanopterin reductase-like flavin-dependent oxidoreductase (luciferase family)